MDITRFCARTPLVIIAGCVGSLITMAIFRDAELPVTTAALLPPTLLAPSLVASTAPSPPRLSSVARFRDSASWCVSNLFLSEWNATNFARSAASVAAWRGSVVRLTHEETYGEDRDHRQYNHLPAVQPLGGWALYGDSDGAKWVSGLADLRAPCVIYSLGSNGDFSFEAAVVRASPCEVHTLDCTLAAAPNSLPERVHFHALCLGDEDAPAAKFRSLGSIMAQLGHTRVDLLKVDIEGFEYRMVEALFRSFLTLGDSALLPPQLVFEQHSITSLPNTVLKWGRGGPSAGRGGASALSGLSAGDMDVLWINLIEMGYVLVHREDQAPCPSCTELVAVRAFC